MRELSLDALKEKFGEVVQIKREIDYYILPSDVKAVLYITANDYRDFHIMKSFYNSVIVLDNVRAHSNYNNYFVMVGNSTLQCTGHSIVEMYGGMCYARQRSNVIAYNSSCVESHDNTLINLYDYAFCEAHGTSNVVGLSQSCRTETHGYSTAKSIGTICAMDKSNIVGEKYAYVVAFGDSKVELKDSARAVMNEKSRATAGDTTYVQLYGNSKCTAKDCAYVQMFGSSTLKISGDASKIIVKATDESVVYLTKEQYSTIDMSNCIDHVKQPYAHKPKPDPMPEPEPAPGPKRRRRSSTPNPNPAPETHEMKPQNLEEEPKEASTVTQVKRITDFGKDSLEYKVLSDLRFTNCVRPLVLRTSTGYAIYLDENNILRVCHSYDNEYDSIKHSRSKSPKHAFDKIAYLLYGRDRNNINRHLIELVGKKWDECLIDLINIAMLDGSYNDRKTVLKNDIRSKIVSGSVMISNEMRVYPTGFVGYVYFKDSLSFEDQLCIFEKYKMDIVKMCIAKYGRTKCIIDTIGDINCYKPYEIVLTRRNRIEVKFEVKEAIQRAIMLEMSFEQPETGRKSKKRSEKK